MIMTVHKLIFCGAYLARLTTACGTNSNNRKILALNFMDLSHLILTDEYAKSSSTSTGHRVMQIIQL